MLDTKKINRLGKGTRKDFVVAEGSGLYLRRQGASKRFIGRKWISKGRDRQRFWKL